MPDDVKEYGTPNGAGANGEESHADSPVPVQSTTAEVESTDESVTAPAAEVVLTPATLPAKAPPKPPPPPPPSDEDDDDGEDDEERGMLRMSFMEHLEELRTRIIRIIMGLVVAFVVSIGFCKDLWEIVSAPAVSALKQIGINPPNLAQITPMEQFNVIYLKLPLLVSIFVGSPWVLYQVWAFISPGLYKREKKWAVPFILCTAGLFITGGLFAYFIAFRYGLVFLLGIGRDVHVTPVVSINEYFDLFVNVTLGVGLVFEMPVIIFFLTLLRLASPRFLLRHSRYAILAITIIAAVVTPTPDVFNMMLFAVPMVLLFYVGILASYILVLRREGRKLPWTIVVLIVAGVIVLAAAAVAVMIYHYHFQFVHHWPFLQPPIRAVTKH